MIAAGFFMEEKSKVEIATLFLFSLEQDEDTLGPPWFFPQVSSQQSRDLIIAMLNPDPVEQLSMVMVSKHLCLVSK